MQLMKLNITICTNNETIRQNYIDGAIEFAINRLDVDIKPEIFSGNDFTDEADAVSTAGMEAAIKFDDDNLSFVAQPDFNFKNYHDGKRRGLVEVDIEIPAVVEIDLFDIDTDASVDQLKIDQVTCDTWQTATGPVYAKLREVIEAQILADMDAEADRQAEKCITEYIDFIKSEQNLTTQNRN